MGNDCRPCQAVETYIGRVEVIDSLLIDVTEEGWENDIDTMSVRWDW